MTQSIRIFLIFLWRDIAIYWKLRGAYFINYALIYPALYAFVFLYVGAQVFFGPGNAYTGTMLFASNIVLTIMTLTYKLNIALLFDLEQDRFIDYQTTLLAPRYVLLERILFTALFTALLLTPYFPIAKLLFGSKFVSTTISWLALELMIVLSTLFGSAYHLMVSCVIKKSSHMSKFWIRLNQPLLILGGFWVPHAIIAKFSPVLGILCYFNPFMYMTEGIRHAILGGSEFFKLSTCTLALITATTLCTLICFYFFKKRTDHL
ncbi:ABC transporter permease [Candidatus Dependentiae bacterium]|nr:ABC transporter permease [Candidatus Dependentiae bacterium]